MRNKARLLIGLSGLALAVVLSAGAWMLAAEPWAQRRSLPDGTVLKFEGVTYGKEHSPPPGAWWTQWAERLHPAPPGFRSAGPFQQERLVFWFKRTPSFWTVARRGPASQAAYLKACPYPWPGTFSESGALVGPVYPPGSYTYPTDQVVVSTAIFPRRGQTIGVRLVDVEGERELARFVVPNPVPGPYPVWKGEPLPLTRRVDGVSFTLLRVEPESRVKNNRSERGAIGKTDTVVVFRDPEGWRLDSVGLSDATGNVLDDPKPGGLWEYRQDETGLTLKGSLPWDEPGWKVHARFVPNGPRQPVTVEYLIKPTR